ncbi:carbohydrate ABC transporter permease [Bifidobacterium avesanii]|uniref:ABC transporter permease subunit n=1 Tax=Bifidobacterium avesanii TaxID=1798157 RepID=A0A7K3TLF1_9BIFI|nr:sugar ABC transporter permease [Bifidobacterium avesanii]KAB8289737.1 ABC transporter permease [Bifidobacterium avesanii]NEG79103.1 ABC transporter permease subunit [Bifidobacterium avesanii]
MSHSATSVAGRKPTNGGAKVIGSDNSKELNRAFQTVHRRNIRNGLIFIAPNFVGFAVLILAPVCSMFYIAFSEWSAFGDPTFNGLANWKRLAKDDLFWASFWQTLYYAVVHIPLTLAIAFGLAVLLNTKLKGRAFFRTAAYFPYITSIVAAAQVWNMMFDPNSGPINQFIRVFTGGAAPGWLSTTQWAMPAVIVVGTWREVGYFMILLLAGLQTIPTELYEAARVDGANGWQQFWKITVPMMRPTLFFVLVTMTIGSFRVLDLTLVMTAGGPGTSTMVIAQYAYRVAFEEQEFGYSSSVSLVLFAMCMIVTIIQFVYNNIKEK